MKELNKEKLLQWLEYWYSYRKTILKEEQYAYHQIRKLIEEKK